MKRIHLLRVADGCDAFADIFRKAESLGIGIGWLQLQAPESAVPRSLETATEAGARRAVAVSPQCTVALKRRRGEAVLRDLLREYFLGCRLVLVHGGEELPLLEPEGEGWRTGRPGGVQRGWSTEELLGALDTARPW